MALVLNYMCYRYNYRSLIFSCCLILSAPCLQMLVPAAASELRSASKFTVSSQQSGTKAVQIKVSKLLISLVVHSVNSFFPE